MSPRHSGVIGVVSDPIGYLKGLDMGVAVGRVAFKLGEDQHTVSRGHLDQNARTGALRDAYRFDHKVTCDECRPHRLGKEMARFVVAFEDWDMWLTVLPRGTVRRHFQEWCKRRGIYYAIVPIWTQQFVVVTTGAVDETSELVEDHNDLLQLVLRNFWPEEKPSDGKRTGISRSKGGFFPPEREYDFFETYHRESGVRCWHLHSSKEAASDCRDKMRRLFPAQSTGWYLRGTTEWHRVGRLSVTGYGLEALADECGISYESYPVQKVASLQLEPMAWDDERLQRFLVAAGWMPPRDDFQVPPITLELRVAVRHGHITGHAATGHVTGT